MIRLLAHITLPENASQMMWGFFMDSFNHIY